MQSEYVGTAAISVHLHRHAEHIDACERNTDERIREHVARLEWDAESGKVRIDDGTD